MPGGLDRIPKDGLVLFNNNKLGKERKEDYMRAISAEKLVYKIFP